MLRLATTLAALSPLFATMPGLTHAGPDDPPSDASADDPVTVDGQTDDAAYTPLGTSPAAPGSDFTGGVLTLKAHRGPDSLYVAVEGKLRAGQGDDTFREMMIFVNADGVDGVDQGTALPSGNDGASPFCCVGGMRMDRETDYGVRLTGGNSAVAYPSVIDYAGFVAGDSTENGQAIDQYAGAPVPDLNGTPLSGEGIGGTYAYQDAADLSSVDETGFEFAVPYDSLALESDDAVQFFATYGDVEGDNLSATLIPDDESDATYGNSEDWTAVSGTQYTDFLGTVEDPFVAANILSPAGDPPLYPFITESDTTVTVSVSADTARVDEINALRLFVDSTEVASTSSDSLAYDLTMDTPDRYQIRAELEITANNVTFGDTTRTVLIRTPEVVDADRPSGVKDGINYNGDGSVTLSLYAPNKDFVYAIGDFTDWAIDGDYFMKRDMENNGAHWWITVESLNSGQQYDYQYFVDGEKRLADPFSHKVRGPGDSGISDGVYPGLEPYPGSKTDNFVSVLRPGQSDFNFSEFTPPDHDELVVYELLLRDFTEESSFSVLTDTLDYLDRLGVNAIELMPVAEFGSNSSWGYNPSFHFALDKAYGPEQTLKQFVEAAHSRGIAVILDVVYNHITGQSPLVKLYGSDNAQNPFLESPQDCGPFNELNQDNSFIRNYIDRANTYWLEEFNVDGFRYDLAFCLGGESGVKDIADHVWDTVDPETYMIMEFFGSFQQEKRLANYRADEPEIDGMMPWHKLNPEYNESSMGYVESGGLNSSNIEPTYFGFVSNNGENFDRPNLISYMESHDEQWLMHKNRKFGRSSEDGTYQVPELETALNRQKLVGAFFFTVPGPRMTWQFGELGYGYAKDECLQDDGGADNCPPVAPGRTAPKPIRWQYRNPQQSPNRVRLYKTWSALLRLRNEYEVFSKPRNIDNDAEGIKMQAQDGDIVRCLRLEDDTLDALIVGNFGVTPRTKTIEVGSNQGACSFPASGDWYNFFEDKARSVGSAQSLSLRPGEFRLYTSQPVTPPPMGLVPSAPVHRRTVSVNSDGNRDFGDTGLDVDFSGVSGSGTVTAEKLNEDPLGTDGISESTVSEYRYVVTADDALGFDGSTEIQLDVSTLGGVDDASAVTLYQRPTEDAGSFTALSTTYDADEDELTAPIDASDTLGEFVLASNSEELPVEMAGFDAATRDDAVRLTWQTASETNNAEFRIQRREGEGTNGEAGAWTTVGSVEGSGTTSQAQSYRFTDDNLPYEADALTYRLAQVDTDGRIHHSKTITVTRSVDEVVLRGTFPNPARNQVTVQYALPKKQSATLRLYDVLGRRVETVAQSTQQGRRQVTLDVSGLTSGVYFLRLTAGDATRTQRLTIVR
jgi:pullulanase/glycogen debranching enzyme